jgi:hypothetical protein
LPGAASIDQKQVAVPQQRRHRLLVVEGSARDRRLTRPAGIRDDRADGRTGRIRVPQQRIVDHDRAVGQIARSVGLDGVRALSNLGLCERGYRFFFFDLLVFFFDSLRLSTRFAFATILS